MKEGRGVEPRSCDAPRPVDEPRHLEHEELEPEVSPEALTLTLTAHKDRQALTFLCRSPPVSAKECPVIKMTPALALAPK